MSAVDLDYLRQWLGRTEERSATIEAEPAAKLSATLDYAGPVVGPGDPLPPCWHWLYFHEAVPASGLGEDGHPARGGFLPPVALPRRMWAGGRLEFHRPVPLGEQLTRHSTVQGIELKQGSSGPLVFVSVLHRLMRGDSLCIEELQHLVYRDIAPYSPPKAQETAAQPVQVQRTVTPDEVMLFRYSALTFNSHRIHFDRSYATDVEGYPDLVVQGPLTATLLLDLVCREVPDAVVARFEFRGRAPLFAGQRLDLALSLLGKNVRLRALNPSGQTAMEAEAVLD